MAIQTAGTPVNGRYIFNQGVIDVQLGSGTVYRLAQQATDISIKQDQTTKPLYVLGSKLPVTIKTSQYKTSGKATLKGVNMTAFAAAFFMGPNNSGQTTDSIGYDYIMFDGQNINIPVLAVTAYENAGQTNPFQFQFNGAVIKSLPFELKADDYLSMDVEWDAISVTIVDLTA